MIPASKAALSLREAQYRCASSFRRFGSAEVGFEGRGEVVSGCVWGCESESRYDEESGWFADRAMEGGRRLGGVRGVLSNSERDNSES